MQAPMRLVGANSEPVLKLRQLPTRRNRTLPVVHVQEPAGAENAAHAGSRTA